MEIKTEEIQLPVMGISVEINQEMQFKCGLD